MTEQEAAVDTGTVTPVPSENKRKLEDFEPQRTQPEDINGNSNIEGGGVEDSDVKRLRLDDKEKAPVDDNGNQDETLEGDKVEENPLEKLNNVENEDNPMDAKLGNKDQSSEGGCETEKVDAMQEPTTDEGKKESADDEQPPKESLELDGTSVSADNQTQPPSADTVQEDGSATKEKTNIDGHSMTRKMEIPNNKVGVLIGKAGDTIRYLQINSGAKIQITRDAEADPRAPSRPVELIGSLESIEKAEKLIKDVISEAEAGGVPSLVARGIAAAQTTVAAEQIQMHVPNDKVGMIIGKGGETIKYLQTTSGARIQVLIPQHLPEGDQSTERIVRVSGDKKQIEIAREMIMEVMTQLPMRQSPRFGGYNQLDRFRGPSGVWGPRGGHYGQPSGYDFHQRAYPSQNPLHRPPPYEHYSAPNYGPRSGYGPGWQQQPPMQRPPYNMYSRPGHFIDGSAGARGYSANPIMGPIPSQANHNYGQPHSADYGYPSQYPNVAPPPSGPSGGYGHGYDEMKYGTQAPVENPYGGPGNLQGYPGYGPNQQYGKPASYSVPIPLQPAAPQTYGPPRPVQPEAPYQAVNPSTVPPYGQNVQPQQSAPYATSVPAQPNYPTADGYAQQQQVATPAYAQQAAAAGYAQPAAQQAPGTYMQQAASGYAQPAAQQAPGVYVQQAASSYAQPGSYASYPTSQIGYPDQSAATSTVYGYQATTTAADPNATYSAPLSSHQGYAQPQPAQAASYDQPVTQ